MFGSIGMPELLIIFVIALIIFGPRKLPELGKSLGRSLAEFRRASNDLRNTLEEEIRIEDRKVAPPSPVAIPPVRTTEEPVVAPPPGGTPHAPDAPDAPAATTDNPAPQA